MRARRKQNTAVPGNSVKEAIRRSPRHWLAAAALCALTLLAYANSFQAGFTLDSNILLLQDPRIREASGENIGLIFQHTYWWPHGESYLYRPLSTLSYLFNYCVLNNADRAPGYHWINFLLHVLNVLLAYSLAHRLIRRFWPAFSVAAVWAIHPVSTESVTNMVGRPDLLAAASILGGLLISLNAAEANAWLRFAWLAGLMAVSAVGIFSKESAAVVAGVIVIFALIWRNEYVHWKALLLSSLAVVPPLAVLWYLRSAALAGAPPMKFPFADNPLTAADFWTARLTALKILGLDLGLMLWPARLSADYSYAQLPQVQGSWQDWIAWTAVAAAAFGVILFQRSRAALSFALLGLIAFLPASNLLFSIGTIRAERFLYLPALGFTACVVIAIDAAASHIKRPQLALLLSSAIVTGFVVRTWIRNSDWRDSLTLATATVRTSPASYKAHAMLADALYQRDPNHANIDRVIEEAEMSVTPLNGLPDLHNVPAAYLALGQYYLTKGDTSSTRKAEAYQRSALALQRSISIFAASDQRYRQEHTEQPAAALPPASPQYAGAFDLLSNAWLRLGEKPRALAAAAETLSLDPDDPEGYRQFANVLLADGRPEQAAEKLMAGAIATADPGLRQDLFKLYQNGGDPKGCAIQTEGSGSAINPACETVHRDICTASTEVITLRTKTGRKDLADETRNTAITEFGCPAVSEK